MYTTGLPSALEAMFSRHRYGYNILRMQAAAPVETGSSGRPPPIIQQQALGSGGAAGGGGGGAVAAGGGHHRSLADDDVAAAELAMALVQGLRTNGDNNPAGEEEAAGAGFAPPQPPPAIGDGAAASGQQTPKRRLAEASAPLFAAPDADPAAVPRRLAATSLNAAGVGAAADADNSVSEQTRGGSVAAAKGGGGRGQPPASPETKPPPPPWEQARPPPSTAEEPPWRREGPASCRDIDAETAGAPYRGGGPRFAGRTVLLVVPESRSGNGNLGHEMKALHSIFLTRRALGLTDDAQRKVTIVTVGAFRNYTDGWGLLSVFADTVITRLEDIPTRQCASRVVVAMPSAERPFWERHWLRDACPPSQLVSAPAVWLAG